MYNDDFVNADDFVDTDDFVDILFDLRPDRSTSHVVDDYSQTRTLLHPLIKTLMSSVGPTASVVLDLG